jgi:chromate transporter
MWFLNGVNAASLGLMLSVTLMLSATALVSWYSWVILTVSVMLIILTKTNTTWILLGSAAAGWLLSLI